MDKNKKKKTNPIVKICLTAFTFYIVICLVDSQIDISKKRDELESINEKIAIQKVDNKKLERIINSEEDDEYIEKLARDKLGFAYPDEKIYIDISGN